MKLLIILLALPFVGLGQSNKPYTRVMSLPDTATLLARGLYADTIPIAALTGTTYSPPITIRTYKAQVDTIPGMCMIGKRGEVDMVWSRPCRYYNKKYFYGKTGVQRIDETNIVYLFVGDKK